MSRIIFQITLWKESLAIFILTKVLQTRVDINIYDFLLTIMKIQTLKHGTEKKVWNYTVTMRTN